MDRTTELAEAGAKAGYVVVADYQSRGRGTHGREWIAPPSSCLMFTAIFRPALEPGELSSLPAMIAQSVAQAVLDVCGLLPDVSPPNDLTIGGKKVCGVLCTSRITGERVDWLLCGIGLNTTMTSAQLPFDGATSLHLAAQRPVPDHSVLLEAILGRLYWLREAGAARCA